MADSVHLARWLLHFEREPIDFVLFPSSPHRHIHPILNGLIDSKSGNMTIKIAPPLMRWFAFPLAAIDILLQNRARGTLLRSLIKKNRFDMIHVIELQHAGYILLRTKLDPCLPKVCITNWGSDLNWFKQFPSHHERLSRLLGIADYYSAECFRDVQIARTLGFAGPVMPVVPNSGGVNLLNVPSNPKPTSERKKIIIKGYTGFVGQAMQALRACECVEDYLTGYEIMIYSASVRVRLYALKMRFRNGLHVRIIKKRTSNNEMLRHFAESRVYLGISLSDGISTSLLEAMATGCYPIQSGTSCADEWLRPNSGSIVEPNSVQRIADSLRESLLNDSKVNHAAQINFQIIAERADSDVVRDKVHNFYNVIMCS